MHSLKEFNKIIGFIQKRPDLEIKKMGRKGTIKLIHTSSKTTMTTHAGDKAYHPIRRWLKKFNIEIS